MSVDTRLIFEGVFMGLWPTRGDEDLRRPREKPALSLPKGGGPREVPQSVDNVRVANEELGARRRLAPTVSTLWVKPDGA